MSFSRGPAMIRDEEGALTGYLYLDLKTRDYGSFVNRADKLLKEKLDVPAGYTYRWTGEYEFELRAKERLKIILPLVVFMIFLLLYLVFKVCRRGGRADCPHVLCDVGWAPASMGCSGTTSVWLFGSDTLPYSGSPWKPGL